MKAVLLLAALAAALQASELEDARDRQDRAALDSSIASLKAQGASTAQAHYRLALAHSYLSEIALELRDKAQARNAAEAGMASARRAIELQPGNAEHHRILGTLCGQVIPANVLAGMRYGRCALDSIAKAVELDPKSSNAWLSRGVGNYYLPESFGGGVALAIADLEKAIGLNPRSADAHLWLGLALRKAGRNTDARRALTRSLQLNPKRIWAKQQLDKTSVQ